jgi:hypothetical protein
MTQSPEIIVQGAIHGSYPGVEVVPRSRAHYGFRLSTRFEDGDPEWNRHADPWDNNIDKCDLRVKWQVRKVSRGVLWNLHLTLADIFSRTSY